MDTAMFVCSGCGYQKSVPVAHSGKRAKCPKCQLEGRVSPPPQQALAQTPDIIKFRCPICDQKLGAASRHAGKWMKCTKCQNTAQIPSPSEAGDRSGVQSAVAGVRAAAEIPAPPPMDDMQELARMERETVAVARPQAVLSLAPAPVEAAMPMPDIYTRPSTVTQAEENAEAEEAVKSSAGWLFAVAALSIVNTIMVLMGSSRVFAIGLGITQVLDGFAMGFKEAAAEDGASSIAGVVTVVAVVADVLIAGMYFLFGFLARKGKRWVFITATILYGLDTLISLVAFQIIGIVLHIIVLVSLARGIKACGELNTPLPAAA